ncbi:hypothetical protein JCM10212_006618 [Sporobolomyces blumeae]
MKLQVAGALLVSLFRLKLRTTSTQRESWLERAKHSVPLAFALYLWNTLTAWVWTLVTSPAAILLDPLSTIAALVVYPVVWIGLAFATFVFWFAGIFGGGKLIDWVSVRFANGYSMVNWANPEIFGPQSTAAIEAARPMLHGKYKTTVPPGASSEDDNPMFGMTKT